LGTSWELFEHLMQGIRFLGFYKTDFR